MNKLLKECQSSGMKETGGILLGYYTPDCDCAIVTEATDAPEDSQRTAATFSRGVKGLQSLISLLWRERQHYYLGEWHFHPGGSPLPSLVDNSQMQTTSQDRKYKCPEPVLFIIGGSPPEHWESRAYVYPKGTGPNELNRME
jgi:integrative and conjugative element protein (TIGR02256 family)